VLKKISNMTKFYCPNKSIYYFFKINTKISTSFRRSMLRSFWIDVPGGDPGGRAHPARAPSLKLEKIWFVGVKSWFFTQNIPTIFAPPSARRNFFKCAPLLTRLLTRPYWPQYVHYQCNSRRWIQNWSVWDICFKWLKLC
jgi:hypothetical protein